MTDVTARKTHLSPTMQATLDKAVEHGGELELWKGGFWTYPGCPFRTRNDGVWGEYRVPDWYAGTQTVRALAERGRLEAVGHFPGGGMVNRMRVKA